MRSSPEQRPSSPKHFKATAKRERSLPGQVYPIPEGRNPTKSNARSSAAQARHWSPSIETILEQPPAALPLRLALGGIVFAAAFSGWAWFGHINELGHAKGYLAPLGEAFLLQATAPGKVTRLEVKEGQIIEQGELVAIIENDLARDEVARLEQAIAAKHLEISQQRIVKAQSLMARQALQAQSQADIQGHEASIAQIKVKQETLQQLIAQRQRDIQSYGDRLERMRPLVEVGALSQDYLFELNQAVRHQESTLVETQGSLRQANTEEAQLNAQLQQKRAEAQSSEIESLKQLQMLDMQIAVLESDIKDHEVRLKSAISQLQQHSLYAPVAGTISSLGIKNIGEVVQPGQNIAKFHALGDPLILQAMLPSQEAGFVEKGMSAKVKFDAYPYQKYGIIKGKVIAISPDARPDPEIGMVYQLEIELDKSSVQDQGRSIALKAGQTATADIVIRQRRIADIILDPFKGLKEDSLSFENDF